MEEVLSFVRSQPKRYFKKGEILVYQGDEPTCLYGVFSGFIKVHDVSPSGSEQLVWLTRRRDVIPLEWLFGSSKQVPFFYTAFTDVGVYTIDKTAFLNRIKDNNEALMVILELITEKYSHITQHLNAAQKPRARDKILYLLDFIAMRFSHDNGRGLDRVEIPLTHQDLANFIGLTRETATLELRRIKDQGIVDYDKNHFYIHTKKLSAALV